VRVHRQTLAKVVTEADAVAGGEPRSVEEAMEIANREEAAREKAANPEFGELADTKTDDAIVVEEPAVEPVSEEPVVADETPVKKPVRRTTKKVDE
jgi:hypothetical protein